MMLATGRASCKTRKAMSHKSTKKRQVFLGTMLATVMLLSISKMSYAWTMTKVTNIASQDQLIRRCHLNRKKESHRRQNFSLEATKRNPEDRDENMEGRRHALSRMAQMSTGIVLGSTMSLPKQVVQAETVTAPNGKANKLTNISDDELAEKIRGDVVDRQFLVTANLSRELYDESSTFTDEIDTYELEKWIKGTQRLFVASKSHVDLEPGSLTVDKSEVVFRFSEYLCFNIPLLQPVVDLTGKVVLKRDPETGLITSYQEFWDQDVASVLKTAKFFG